VSERSERRATAHSSRVSELSERRAIAHSSRVSELSERRAIAQSSRVSERSERKAIAHSSRVSESRVSETQYTRATERNIPERQSAIYQNDRAQVSQVSEIDCKCK